MLQKVVLQLQLFRRNCPEPRNIFEGANCPFSPYHLVRLLDVSINVVSKKNKKVGIELQDCIPDRLSSHNSKVQPLHSSRDNSQNDVTTYLKQEFIAPQQGFKYLFTGLWLRTNPFKLLQEYGIIMCYGRSL